MNSQDLTYREHKFSLKTVISDFENKKTFIVNLPHKKSIERVYPHQGTIYQEYRVRFSDENIIFYISNDVWNGSQLNANNLVNKGMVGYNKKSYLDTIANSGFQSDGKYWNETILGEIVVGCINVPPTRKDEFENIILSVRQKE